MSPGYEIRVRVARLKGNAAFVEQGNLHPRCGSGLARDGIPAVCPSDRIACIAGKPAPTGFAVFPEFGACHETLWERACSR
ncbi:MAG TPA: hypothetical protein DD669_04915 [Pseudomonas sp.]|nr:hypothetical protein [Pseudomonas sp.]